MEVPAVVVEEGEAIFVAAATLLGAVIVEVTGAEGEGTPHTSRASRGTYRPFAVSPSLCYFLLQIVVVVAWHGRSLLV